MKKIIYLFVMFLLLLINPMIGLAFQNEPNGFRDLYWGESLTEIEGARTVQYVNSKQEYGNEYSTYYVNFKDGESKVLSGVPIAGENVRAFFYNGKLWRVDFGFHEDPNGWNSSYEKLKLAMIQLYGRPDEDINEKTFSECLWVGEETTIELIRIVTIHKDKAACVVNLKSTKISNEISNPARGSGW